ncbi:VTC domain protein [Planctomycetes bacterium CA13]|uniref:VTC domain protein n=1 Tax=Novipirellula herctigrandis TaxID=2527986 RepID=A0A5C5YWI8_9BACT|nr:VTC domain protein [Planctomycetes bacterium CA13]
MSNDQADTYNKRIELKYLLDECQSQQVKLWAREHLETDAYCDPQLGDSYDIHTLYLDSSELDLYYRTGVIGKTKHRIRRYGCDPGLWIETKRKKKFVVKKNRTMVIDHELHPRVTASDPKLALQNESSWCGDWFLDRIANRQLQPSVQIYYRRFARTAVIGGESMRLTIDSDLQAMASSDWRVREHDSELMSAIDNVQILELKFHNHMPYLFKELLREFPLSMTSFSKYNAAVEATRTVAFPNVSDARKSTKTVPLTRLAI